MSKPPKDGKLIYHLTSLENLEGILKHGLIARRNLNLFDDVAEQEIISHRQVMGLDEYVPFHFFAGTPFDGAVQKKHSKKEFIFLTVTRLFAEKSKFQILTQHPLSDVKPLPLSYSDGIQEINWRIMELRDYSNHECSEICMAECLSPIVITPENLFCVFTPNEEVKNKVLQIKANIKSGSFNVNVNPTFFIR